MLEYQPDSAYAGDEPSVAAQDLQLPMTTPARRQYLDIKAQYPDTLLAYQVGDFFEFFDDDAKIASADLQITLTARSYGTDGRVPLAGVPLHALDTYLARLVGRGRRVAVCEQVSAPGRGLVERAVTRILSPGVLTDPGMLAAGRDNLLVAVAFERDARRNGAPYAGIAWIEATTGAFACAQFVAPGEDALLAELQRLAPAEILLAKKWSGEDEIAGSWRSFVTTECPAHYFESERARIRLCRHFDVASLAAFGCDQLPLAVSAAGAVLAYLERMNPALLPLLTGLRTYDPRGYVEIDGRTWRALEVLEPAPHSGRTHGATLLQTLDLTRTAPGARLLRRTLTQPLKDSALLEERLDAVAELHADVALREQLGAQLDGAPDLERLTARIVQGAAYPREVLALAAGLARAPALRSALRRCASAGLQQLAASLDSCDEAREVIERAIEDPQAGTGRLVRPGYSAELDALASSAGEAKRWIAALELSERERTGIRSLRVGYNKVFGYYIEVSKPNLSRVPDNYQRRQTLANGERYITEELRAREGVVLNAEEKIVALERDLYLAALREVAGNQSRLRGTAAALAQLDVWLALAEVAAARGYTRPELSDDTALEIRGGRHPVVEATLDGAEFTANDLALTSEEDAIGSRAILLTGPNMAGKSTYLRQVAIITLLAQIGSFVPVEHARVGLVDRIFTRVGADDDLARGMSTFMLEMVETAYILRHATPRSLIILDEVGRGTSALDGLALARAVIEHLHDTVCPRTLFATHYHELAGLAETLPRLRVFQMAVAERAGEAIFLHRVEPGASAISYGIQVARMAGLPSSVTTRARGLLDERAVGAWIAEPPAQYHAASAIAPEEREITLALASLNVAATTPIEAINLLYSLQQRALLALQGSEPRS
jgi:DNA mismatch repair protein MutS